MTSYTITSITDDKVVAIIDCKHEWDKPTGIWQQGKAWIGLEGKWLRTCANCGLKESFSKGMFNGGWFSADNSLKEFEVDSRDIKLWFKVGSQITADLKNGKLVNIKLI